MELAATYFVCWVLFISLTLLALLVIIVCAILKLLVVWPLAVLACLMLGMNLRLFVLFPRFLTWVMNVLL